MIIQDKWIGLSNAPVEVRLRSMEEQLDWLKSELGVAIGTLEYVRMERLRRRRNSWYRRLGRWMKS